MKVIIAGSRSIFLMTHVESAIKHADFDITEVVSGTAKGPDTLGIQWAYVNKVPTMLYSADWKTHGKSAGFKRNREMGDYADALIAVWDGFSPGTAHMIDYMQRLNKPVYIYYPNQNNLKDDANVSSNQTAGGNLEMPRYQTNSR